MGEKAEKCRKVLCLVQPEVAGVNFSQDSQIFRVFLMRFLFVCLFLMRCTIKH